ncbi:NAD(P)H-dependent oxidoreductase [Rhodococcus sp. MSC1_016]|jgi:NAD(P)H dehydrogenase (quinone)|uniref:NAD(P)H-dependent oxidoreductase n=1 Tax=Rhodococcus sp. MSC1_016 TaxID=2909266 RepID=UPI0020302581|nr:NAD(P)H-dependent oxidoreductase [Rhodococcus sp. MSC1_016]
MNILVVFAHPEQRSFCGALKDTAVRTLTDLGHDVSVSDLYAMKWNAELDAQDFTGERVDENYLDLSREQEHAFATQTQAFDIELEQRKVAEADLILFHFPVWWFSMPAVLKGWVDRVFARGFAYSAGRKYGTGHFTGKKAMVCLTTGTASTLYEPNGIDGDLLHVLWPIHNGILAYTGFTVLPPFAAWMPGNVTAEERQGYLDAYARSLTTIEDTEPLFFHPWEDYDRTQRLKPGVKARSGVQWNPSAGQTFEQAAQEYDRRAATER